MTRDVPDACTSGNEMFHSFTKFHFLGSGFSELKLAPRLMAYVHYMYLGLSRSLFPSTPAPKINGLTQRGQCVQDRKQLGKEGEDTTRCEFHWGGGRVSAATHGKKGGCGGLVGAFWHSLKIGSSYAAVAIPLVGRE